MQHCPLCQIYYCYRLFTVKAFSEYESGDQVVSVGEVLYKEVVPSLLNNYNSLILNSSPHIHSAKSKAPRGKLIQVPDFQPGDIAFVTNHGTKHDARDPYLVTGTDDKKVKLQKILHPQTTAKNGPAVF